MIYNLNVVITHTPKRQNYFLVLRHKILFVGTHYWDGIYVITILKKFCTLAKK